VPSAEKKAIHNNNCSTLGRAKKAYTGGRKRERERKQKNNFIEMWSSKKTTTITSPRNTQSIFR
jgi:hypothetical protein